MFKGLRALREKAQKTQIELANDMGVSQSYYNELERGVKTNPTYDVLQRLAAALNCTIDELLKDQDQTA